MAFYATNSRLVWKFPFDLAKPDDCIAENAAIFSLVAEHVKISESIQSLQNFKKVDHQIHKTDWILRHISYSI